ncbi:MAG: hypothetical protein HYV40_01395 [Candidatus Levybacteria bacterium]|nr:hypothetical protein [Candidatus Levybacteria bacterium]
MAKAARVKASTQKFTEIIDIIDSIVLLEGGYACIVIEVTASNFALLSKKEQDAKIYSYASLLNSLGFPIQIIVRNQRVDITSYLKSLEEQEKLTKNEMLAQHIKLYREFVHQMIKVNIVLNKQFYIVITYSALEQGATGATATVKKGEPAKLAFAQTAQKSLLSKADALLSQLRRLALSAKVLEKDELVKLYYNIYNQDNLQIAQVADDMSAPMVKVKQ